VVTVVPGVRTPEGEQQPAILKVNAEVENTGNTEVSGTLEYKLGKQTLTAEVKIAPHARQIVYLPDLQLNNPKLWWPIGNGPQNLYDIDVRFLINSKKESNREHVSFGIRELQTVWNTHTKSRELHVNGQKIFIKGGNRILSDALLRFSPERYDAEVRYHKDMNLNLIRVWGGGITERPEFYDACDKYGILVMQDFWVSGDCNGRWYDPLKKEDTTTRRNYPDDHKLFIASVEDQVKMLRNHPSLALWCGGNEIAPPADILSAIKESILPLLDSTRYFFNHSNDDSMSYKGGDGPYTIQPANYSWEHRSFPFNSEIGSVGICDYESLERFIPKENMIVPQYDNANRKWKTDSVWQYHKYTSYDSAIEVYGHATDVKDFAKKAQLVNYDQYRAMMEGASSHMWDWYTGIIMRKTQNPWTAMVGQMYDVYLDPNAAMYGMSKGAKPVHIMYDPIQHSIRIANNNFTKGNKLHWRLAIYQKDGVPHDLIQGFAETPPGTCNEYGFLHNTIDGLAKDEGLFMSLRLADIVTGEIIDDNLYWIPDSTGHYPILTDMPKAAITATAKTEKNGNIEVTIAAPEHGQIAFFNRISVVDAVTKKRILPAFSNNNYISVLPGNKETIQVSFAPQEGVTPMISIEGWNVDKVYIPITKTSK
ncbi:MAG: glycoside hydrolase family 2 sugar binding, partial [Flavipsychrobacter sp.]|nr:glycoside hydrolase family 2 sugar binding [Flavipsychrobacter sp.]